MGIFGNSKNFYCKVVCAAAALGCFANAQAQQADAPAQKDWTVLVFLNAINSLDSYAPYNLNQMEKVGSTDNVNVVVEWGSESAKKVVRMLMKKDPNANTSSSTVSSPVVQDLGLIDMGDYKQLIDFVQWGIKNYPAKHYFIDIWDHGNGWEKSLRSSRHSQLFKDLSYDDLSGNQITTEQLGTAMATIKQQLGQNVDILGFDACLMGMAEVAGEVADSVDYVVGSEDLVPDDGWPYDDFLNQMNQPAVFADPKAVASAIVNTYGASYAGGSQGTEDVTLASYNIAQFKSSYPAYKNLADALNTVAGTSPQALNDVISKTEAFDTTEYRDIGSFTDQLTAAHVADANVVAALAAQLKATVEANHPTGTFANAKGMSISIPPDGTFWSNYSTRYSGLKFVQATGWSTWIATLAPSQSQTPVNGRDDEDLFVER